MKESYTATLKYQTFYYDTLRDLHLHGTELLRKGYRLYSWSEEDLYAEYEMNEIIEGEIEI